MGGRCGAVLGPILGRCQVDFGALLRTSRGRFWATWGSMLGRFGFDFGLGACLRLMLGLVYLAQDIQDVHAHEQPCPRYLRLGLIWGLVYLAQDIRTSTPCSQEVPGAPDLPSTFQETDFPEFRLST